MGWNLTKTQRRTGVVINYIAVVLFAVLFCIGEYRGWTTPGTIGIFISLSVWLVSFIIIYVKTRLWRFVHTKVDRLDERERQLTYESLRYAYAIFTVICLSYILVSSLVAPRLAVNVLTPDDYPSFGLVMMWVLLYLAHILPASIIAWTEREVILG
jgi:hypothetical protein